MTEPPVIDGGAERGRAPRLGIFDSGIGGLTVVRELVRRLPAADVVYFGDTARLPYGTKSASTVRRFSIENTHFLLNQGAELVVVACNTSSAVALETLRRQFDVPVLGVVEPGARGAVRATRNRRIGVIGTVATIESGGYREAILAQAPECAVHDAACPLLVPFAEEGWLDHPVTLQVIGEYLAPLLAARIDTLVLGCTHYPVLKAAIRAAVGDGVVLVDSAEEVVADVARALGGLPAAAPGTEAAPAMGSPPLRRYWVSDIPRRFREVGGRFLGSPLEDVQLVDQTDLPWFERGPGPAVASRVGLSTAVERGAIP